MITINLEESKRCNGKVSCFVSFQYNDKIVSVLRSMPERYWDKDTKVWEVPYKYMNKLLSELPDFEFEVNLLNPALISETPNVELAKVISGFNFKTKPFSHQMDGFKYGLQYDKWLLGDEQGLGKTKQVIDIAVAKKQYYGYKHCLIICGVNGLKWNWVNEVATHSDETAHILGQTVRGNRVTVGGNEAKLNDLMNIQLIDDYFIVTNVESLRDETIVAQIMHLCKNGVINMIAADEVHKMKNPTSQQGKGFLKLYADTMIALTGTPLMNNPMDLYIILKWLGYENHSFYSFKKHYCVFGGFGGYEIVGYKNLAQLQAQLNEIMLRRKKEEVLDLPDKTYLDEYVEMTPKQKQIYNEVTNEIKMNIDQIKVSKNPLAELIRMRQATGFTGILSSVIKESAKLDRMEELVQDAVENGKKVVIFSNWTQMTLPAYNRLATHFKGTYITGEVDSETRQANVDRFQNDPDCKFVVGSIGALGTGLTLTEGAVVIFLDHPWTRAAYDQAVDRCHRIGQTKNLLVINLLCKNTIDERIWEIVNRKGAMSDALIDGQTIKNRELIDYLLD